MNIRQDSRKLVGLVSRQRGHVKSRRNRLTNLPKMGVSMMQELNELDEWQRSALDASCKFMHDTYLLELRRHGGGS